MSFIVFVFTIAMTDVSKAITTYEFISSVDSTNKLYIDTNYNELRDASGEIVNLPTDAYTIVDQNYNVATISKTNIINFEEIKTKANLWVNSEVAVGSMTLPKDKLGILPYFPAAGANYTVANYIKYLLYLDDKQLYNAMASGAVGRCSVVWRDYLPQTLKAAFPCSTALKVPNALPTSNALSKRIQCVTGSIATSTGAPVKCLNGYNAQVCLKSSVRERLINMVRMRLNYSLLNPSQDICDIASTVSSLNSTNTAPSFNMDQLVSSDNIIFRKDANKKIRCFLKLRAGTSVPKQRMVSLGGAQTVELNQKVCERAAYRDFRTNQKLANIDQLKSGAIKLDISEASDLELINMNSVSVSDIPPDTTLVEKHEGYATASTDIQSVSFADLESIGGIDPAELSPEHYGEVSVVVNSNTTTTDLLKYDKIETDMIAAINDLEQAKTDSLNTLEGTTDNYITDLQQASLAGVQQIDTTKDASLTELSTHANTLTSEFEQDASIASSNALSDIQLAETQAISGVTEAGADSLADISTATDSAEQQIASATTSGTSTITNATAAATNTINSETTSALSDISTATISGEQQIASATTSGTNTLTNQTNAALSDISTATTSGEQQIASATTSGTNTLSTQTDAALADISTATTSGEQQIANATTSGTNTLTNQTNAALSDISTATTSGEQQIANATNSGTNTLTNQTNAALSDISTATTSGEQQIANATTSGTNTLTNQTNAALADISTSTTSSQTTISQQEAAAIAAIQNTTVESTNLINTTTTDSIQTIDSTYEQNLAEFDTIYTTKTEELQNGTYSSGGGDSSTTDGSLNETAMK